MRFQESHGLSGGFRSVTNGFIEHRVTLEGSRGFQNVLGTLKGSQGLLGSLISLKKLQDIGHPQL